MAAPEGNQFWKLRSKHGRDTLFASPDAMWEAACEYFQWCVDNPLYETEVKVVAIGLNQGSSIEKIEVPKLRVFTYQGLCRYLNCNEVYFNQFKPPSEDFSKVVDEIRGVIYDQKFSGAAAGLLNSNIIARDLGLTDKTQSEIKGELKIDQITGMNVK